MQKCPLCDKKIPEAAKFCPHCGWDLTDHELTPPQIARIQEEIVDAKFGYVRCQVEIAQFTTVGLVFIILSMLALREVIAVQAPWVMSGIAAAFFFASAVFGFLLAGHSSYHTYRLK